MIPFVAVECAAVTAAFATLYYTFVHYKGTPPKITEDVDAIASEPLFLPSDHVSTFQYPSNGTGADSRYITVAAPFHIQYYGEAVLTDNEGHRLVQSQGNAYLDAFRGHPERAASNKHDRSNFQALKPALLAMYAREEEQFIGGNTSNWWERIAQNS